MENLFVLENFWDSRKCADLIKKAQRNESEEAGIYLNGKTNTVSRTRRTHRILIDPVLRREISESLWSVKERLEQYFQIQLNGMQDVQLLQYRQGDYFHTHQDEGREPSDNTRKVSVVLFLNTHSLSNGFEGGEIVFYKDSQHSLLGKGTQLKPAAGLLIGFFSYVLHEVKEITAGERYSVVTWFY